MPKLKVGDTFVYTKEMNDAKIKSTSCNGDASSFIGQKLKIYLISNMGYRGDNAYECDGNPFFFSCDIIDRFLPKGTKDSKRKDRTWKKHFESSDDIKVSKDSIEIDGETFTPETLKIHFGKCGSALKMLKNIK